jgi:hypothetical protein
MLRGIINKVRFPMWGYVLILLGFLNLGLFVGALALGWGLAPVLGIAMVACYAAGVACFYVRRWQMANQDADAEVRFGFDPIRGDVMRDAERRYLQTYRGVTADEGPGEVRHLSERRPISVPAVERRSA